MSNKKQPVRLALAHLLALLLLSSLQMAATDFSLVYNHPNGLQSNVASDVAVQLSMGAVTPVVCTGTAFTPSASISSNWYSSYYTSKLASNAPGFSYLVSYASTQPQRPITWVDSGDYTSITNQQSGGVPGYFLNVGEFNSFMSGIGVSPSQSTQRSGYTDPFGANFPGTCTSAPYCYKADLAFYCKGITNLVSSNPSYNQNIPNYLGAASVPFTPFPLNTPGTFTFKPTFTLGGCIASGRTYTQPAGGNPAPVENVHLYKNAAFAAVTIDNAATQTVTVKNPFSCNLVQFSTPVFTPSGAVAPGAQMSFSFTVANPPSNGEDARVNSVAASGWFPQPTPQPQPYNVNVPLVVPKNGVPVTVSGKLDAPSAPGAYTFNLVVNFGSAGADCTGSTVSCSPKTYPVSFTVSEPPGPDPVSCTLALSGGHGTTFTAPDSAVAVATCRSASNAVVPCGALAWSTTATGSSMAPASTTTPPGPSQSTFTLSYTNAPQSAQIKAQHAAFSCTLPIAILPPDYISTITAPASAQVGTAFSAAVETKNIGSAASLSTTTKLQFNGGTPQAFGVPGLSYQDTQQDTGSFTCPATAGTYTLTSTADST
ncbi:MAG: CARDB domain-containing protein, partial [Candidatus Micrarchaeia archaeon]